MKRYRTYFGQLIFTLVLVQMLNISLNYVNIYNAGQSGHRHKIALNTHELSNFIDLFAGLSLHAEFDDSNDCARDIFLENFDLGFFACEPQLEIPTEVTFSLRHNKRLPEYKDHVPDLNSPPPKTV